jgi:hypothetical protein
MVSVNMKILIELPDNWLNIEESQNLFLLSGTVRDQVHKALAEAILKQVKLPKFKVDQKELKRRVMAELVERAIDRN